MGSISLEDNLFNYINMSMDNVTILLVPLLLYCKFPTVSVSAICSPALLSFPAVATFSCVFIWFINPICGYKVTD